MVKAWAAVAAVVLAAGCGDVSRGRHAPEVGEAMVVYGDRDAVALWRLDGGRTFSRVYAPVGTRVLWLGPEADVFGAPAGRVRVAEGAGFGVILYARPGDLRPVPR